MVALLMVSACSASTEVESADATPRPQVVDVEPTALPSEPTATEQSPTPEPTATVAPAPTEAPAATATSLPEPTSTSVPIPTATVAPTAEPIAVATTDHSGLAGTRGLTLQWISWEPLEWGRIEFIPLADGSYAVSGEQQAPEQQGVPDARFRDSVTIDGTIVRVSDRELLFTGEVSTHISYINDGEPCLRSGEITFLATGERRFWRMQDLLNCDDIHTDYVDIYFG